MTIARPTLFWITITAIALVALLLLRPILLPFAVGMVLAYLLVPAVDRLEQVGINRSLVALTLVLLLVVGFVGIVLLLLPAIVGELNFFIDQFPRYVARMQSLVADSSRPWLHNVLGEELHIGESSVKIATTMGGAWLDDALRSLWSGGEALVSLLSLLVVVPIVSIYLLIGWKQMLATVDGWLPAGRREAVRALGREIHDTVAGFVRGRSSSA
jgi:predicted PurR-regulated permease PerM